MCCLSVGNMEWWGLWQTEGCTSCLKDCLEVVVDLEMLASFARPDFFFFFLEARNGSIYVKFPNGSMLATKSYEKFLRGLIKRFVGEIWPIPCPCAP